MSEFLPEPELEKVIPIDRQLVVGRLQEYGVSIELEDFEGEDDDDVMGIAASFCEMYDIDIDEIFPQISPIVKRRKDELGEPSEI